VPYHVRVTPRSGRHDEVKLDLSEKELRERFLQPYYDGRPIVIGGRTISVDDLERIRITFTEENSDALFPIVRAERRASNVITTISDEWYIADKGRDVTDEFITGPPGEGVRATDGGAGPSVSGPAVVFVVHGRNLALRDAMFSFLRALGLHPLEWTEALLATGKTTPYIGEILDKAFDIAQALVVLFSPDDEARLREPYRSPDDPPHEVNLTAQARPNVLFEAGMAMGRFPERTILVEVGNLRPFSDLGGRHVVRLNNSTQRRQELALRLQAAGCPIRLSGTDWQSTGNFDAALDHITSRST